MSTALVMNGSSSHLHRKPLPNAAPHTVAPQSVAEQQSSGHRHTRTSSSSVFPSYNQPHQQPTYVSTMNQYMAQNQSARRTLSNATASTSSTTTSGGPSRTNSGALRRSSSSRSGSSASPTSYVALMRKQKATVWCDRAQHEDPRILAAQRAARHRAQLEVVGGSSHHLAPSAAAATRSRNSNASSGSMASNVRSKIRHHGAPKASTYNPSANLAGSGVPMRLSATEVDEGDSDDDSYNAQTRYHQRTGSGRSSLGSGLRAGYPRSSLTGGAPRFSTGSTPPSAEDSSPSDGMGDVSEETPVPGMYNKQAHGEYFDHKTTTGLSGSSGSSGSSGEGRENSFGNLGSMPQRAGGASSEGKTADDLRRRGSVDERNMTMSGVRLFVANPDLSD